MSQAETTALPRCAECKKLCRPRDTLFEGDDARDHAGTHLVEHKNLRTSDAMYLVLPVYRSGHEPS